MLDIKYSLLKSFDKIYIIDLHGNARKKEKCPDGSKDENVFNIQQGVSINIFVKKKGTRKELANVYHTDVYGLRQDKYDFCNDKSLKDIDFTKVNYEEPYYFFVPKDFSNQKKYDKGFSVTDLFNLGNVGLVTSRDNLVVSTKKDKLLEKIKIFADINKSDNEIRNLFFSKTIGNKYPKGDNRDWKLPKARQNIANNNHKDYIHKINYRPFDNRYIYYSKDMIDFPRHEIMDNFIEKENICFITARSNRSGNINHFFVSKYMVEVKCGERTTGSYSFPLYTYNQDKTLLGDCNRTPNLKTDIVKNIAGHIKCNFTSEPSEIENTFSPIDILNYIYGILYSHKYRNEYAEFLKIDFPKIPYPKDREYFFSVGKLGSKIIKYHLLDDIKESDISVKFPVAGNCEISECDFKDNKVYINGNQYFENISKGAFEFQIGGYVPAQKWIKDRKGHVLSYEDIMHYSKLVTALENTIRIMKNIDNLIEI